MHRFALHRVRETQRGRDSNVKSNSILIGHEELGRFIREVLIANGARTKDAAIVAEGLVWANLRGGDGHGVSRLPRYLGIIAHG